VSDRKRQLIVAGAAAAGLLVVFAVARSKSRGAPAATYVSGSPDFGGAALGGGEDDWAISGGGGWGGLSLSELVDAVKGLVPAPAPVNVTVNTPPAPAAAPAAQAAGISPVGQPGASSDPTPAPPAGNYSRAVTREPIFYPTSDGRLVAAPAGTTPQDAVLYAARTGKQAVM